MQKQQNDMFTRTIDRTTRFLGQRKYYKPQQKSHPQATGIFLWSNVAIPPTAEGPTPSSCQVIIAPGGGPRTSATPVPHPDPDPSPAAWRYRPHPKPDRYLTGFKTAHSPPATCPTRTPPGRSPRGWADRAPELAFACAARWRDDASSARWRRRADTTTTTTTTRGGSRGSPRLLLSLSPQPAVSRSPAAVRGGSGAASRGGRSPEREGYRADLGGCGGVGGDGVGFLLQGGGRVSAYLAIWGLIRVCCLPVWCVFFFGEREICSFGWVMTYEGGGGFDLLGGIVGKHLQFCLWLVLLVDSMGLLKTDYSID